MQPSLDDVQQAVNRATAFVLEVSRNIAQWGQQRFKPVEIGEDDGEESHHHHTYKTKMKGHHSGELTLTSGLKIRIFKGTHFQRHFKRVA